MALIRIVYEFGVEAISQPDGWVVTSAERGDRRVFAGPAALTNTLGLLPCVITERFESSHERSLLLRADSRTPFGLGVTELCTGSLLPEAVYHAHHIAYLVGAVAYHYERLAELCASICRRFASFPEPGPPMDCASFSHEPEPYYEFDAAITAARRAYDASRYLLWKCYGGDGSVPSSFARTLVACTRLTGDLRSRLEESWSKFGQQLTDYRDCIQHYVPVDFGLADAWMEKVAGTFWSVRIRIPDNPQARSKEAFEYTQGRDALSYCRGMAAELLTVMAFVIDSTARPLSKSGRGGSQSKDDSC